MQRHQRGRTRGVDRDGGAFQTELVGDPAGDDAAGAVAAGIVVVHDAGEDASPAAPQRGGVDAGPFERLPRQFQREALLRVGTHRLLRAHAEEPGVELRSGVEEAAAWGVVAVRLGVA